MQKTMSARVDEAVVALVDRIAREKKMTKREILEEAIKNFWKTVSVEKEIDSFQASFGAWERDESAEETVRKSRDAFNRSMRRHHTS